MKVIYVSAWSRTKSIVTSQLLIDFLHVLNFPLQDFVYSFLRVTINSTLMIVLEAENCSHTLEIWAWLRCCRDGPAVRSTGYPSRGPRLSYQYSHIDSQLTVMPIPGIPHSLLASNDTRHTQSTQIHMWPKCPCIEYNKKEKCWKI